MNRIQGPELLLITLALGFFGVALYRWRTRRGGRWRVTPIVAASAIGLVAGAGLFLGDERQLMLAGLAGGVAGLTLASAAVARLIRVPLIAGRLQPWIGPIAWQALLFTIVLLLVAGPWHVAILLEQAEGYVTDFLVKHNVNRALAEVNSTGVSDFYLRTLVWGYFPWSAFIPIMLAGLIGWTDREVLRRQGFEIYLLASTFVIFAAFTSSMTKFTHYLAPMLIPMAVLIGITLARMTERSNPWSRLGWLAALALFALPALDLTHKGGVRYLVSTFTVKRWVPEELEPGAYVLALFGVATLVLLVNTLLRSTVMASAFLIVALLFAHYNSNVFIPELSRHKSLKWLVESYERYRQPADLLGFHGSLKHGIFFYTRGEAELLSDVSEFMTFMDPARHAFTIIERTDYFKLRSPYALRFPGNELHVIDESHFDYSLISNFPIPGVEDDTDSGESEVIGDEEE